MATAHPTLLDIAEVARRTGLAPSTLRYYEERGLISSAARRGLRRQYSPEVVSRIAVIVLCQQAGFTLPEVGEVLATDGRPEWRRLVAEKLNEVNRTIRDLTTVAEGLAHALDCPSPEVLRCPHFHDELDRVLPADPTFRKRATRA
jgi:DNA-binding transcriptional MerR regulator